MLQDTPRPYAAPALDADTRTADARAFLGEFFPDPGQGPGLVRLALSAAGGWTELEGFRADRGPFAGLVEDHGEMLDMLAASLVAHADEGLDAFASPYAHAGARRLGGAVSRRHVHADIDGPVDLDRARSLGALVVASGSTTDDGRPHAHAYIRVDRELSGAEHRALCTGLGRIVGGDAADASKVGDADVLRLPGTWNHKNGERRPVEWIIGPDDPSVTTWTPEPLARLLGVSLDEPEPAEGREEPRTGPTPAAAGGSVNARLDGLVRAVRDAPRGAGNVWLHWAAGKAGALAATTDEVDEDDTREALVEAYLERPTTETAAARRREAERTIASGWRWGAAHPEEALRDRTRPALGVVTMEPVIVDSVTGEVLEDTPPPAPAATELDDDEFWEARPLLSRCRAFARARRVGPWALLGAVLARAAAAVPPSVVLPPTRGSVASLNSFVAIVGPSGSGKSAVTEAARDFLQVEGGGDFLETAPGSGEGLIAAYVHTDASDKKPRQVQTCASVLLEVDEVQALGSLTSRTAATLLPFLKTAWSGKLLATQNAETSRRRRVEPHAYRLAITAGVQPANAGVILDDAAGGFPQRWLWMPTYDPDMRGRHEHVDEPEPLRWRCPVSPVSMAPDGSLVLPGRIVMRLPAEAVDAILDAAEAQNRPIGAPTPAGVGALDGHALLARAKVAALLALLEGRPVEVTEDDWRLAGHVMAVSDRTRAEVIAARGAEAAAESDRKAVRQGRSAAIAEDAATETKIVRAMGKLRELLGDGEEHAAGALRKRLATALRPLVDDAADRMVESGEVLCEERENARGVETVYLRLAAAEGAKK